MVLLVRKGGTRLTAGLLSWLNDNSATHLARELGHDAGEPVRQSFLRRGFTARIGGLTGLQPEHRRKKGMHLHGRQVGVPEAVEQPLPDLQHVHLCDILLPRQP